MSLVAAAIVCVVGVPTADTFAGEQTARQSLDRELRDVLHAHGFTGGIQATLERRLGRPLDVKKAEVGRLLFFDNILGLHGDNSCAGCHSPAAGFGDSQPMTIGVDNSGVESRNRPGPRNQRRAPSVVNTQFNPALMWTARFVARSGDPFHGSLGSQFFPPENVIATTQTLLQAQASLPSTELVEMAGFTGITHNPGRTSTRFRQFDDGDGEALPAVDATGTHNAAIQDRIDKRLNRVPDYLRLFGEAFNNGTTLPAGAITLHRCCEAPAEFQMSLPGARAQ